MNNNIKGFQRTEAIRQLLLDNFQTPNTIIGVMEKAGITDSYKYVCQHVFLMVKSGYLIGTGMEKCGRSNRRIYHSLKEDYEHEYYKSLQVQNPSINDPKTEIIEAPNVRYIKERHTTPAPRRHTPVYIGSTFGMV